MSQSGVPPAKLIERVRNTRTSYALHGSDYGKLKALGVSDAVLDFMQQSPVNDVDLLTHYWTGGSSLGGCKSCYPQPVDMDRIASGYGSADSNVAGCYRPGLPPGVPEWVPSDLGGFIRKRVSISEIEDMSKRGESDVKVIEVLRHSRLQLVLGTGTSRAITTYSPARISGSQLARLRSEGVHDRVLDELQARFLAQFIEAEPMRYQSWGKKK